MEDIKEKQIIINRVAVKSKAVAVVLAVLFSFWSWLYTYGRSKSHFWSSVVLFILAPFIGVVIGFDMFSFWSNLITYLIYLAIWIWSIADNATKSYDFFINYPNS